jgi:hypothetical protein
MDSVAKWYFIMVTVVIALIVCGAVTYQWRQMDCSLTLGQAGRSPDDIKEICYK